MQFLYLLEKIRNPILDFIMSTVTYFGDELLFLILVLLMFWCVDKRAGYYLIAVGFVGIVCNQSLKMLFRIPRPWVLDPGFTIVESARAAATGYSFPSGHTQSAVGMFGAILRWSKQTWVRSVSLILLLLVPFSRMYLGVHTPWDVGVSFVLALALVFAFYPVIRRADTTPRIMYVLVACILLLTVGNLLFVAGYSFPADVDAENLAHAVKTAYTMLGAASGLCLIWFFDQKFLHIETKAVWWAQILKMVGGILLVLAVRTFLKAPLNALFDGHKAADAVRYFLVTVTAGVLWPMTFPFFSRLGKKPDREHDAV